MAIDVTAPPLIATAPTRRADRLAALLIVLLSVAAFLIILPRANEPSTRMTAFIPADDTGLALIDAITAMLLIGQFVHLRIPSLLVVACGYFFNGFIVVAHLLSAAEAIRAIRPQSANPGTTAWIYILWHGLFPVFLMFYAALSQSRFDRPVSRGRRGFYAMLSILAAAMFAGLCVAFAIVDQRIVTEGDNHAFALLTALATWIVSAAAFIFLYVRTRARRILDMWLCVVLFAWLLDILVGGLVSSDPFNFGWYAGRLYGLVAAIAVLFALLLETGAHYGQLTRAFAELQAQSTALSQSEAALRQAQKMEAIGQLTGGVAHDFNNLLTVIIGSLDMLEQQTKDDPRATRLTHFAMQAAVKGEQLTKQLLAFSRRRMLNPQIRDPNGLIRDFDELMRRALGPSIHISLDLDPKAGTVRVDPAQFEAAILNLAVNARDAMDGKGEITIATRHLGESDVATECPEAAPGSYVMIALSDTGTGMDAETISRAFDPFFTTKPTGKGTGLGLSQVYGFAASSQGHAKIDSEAGKGTTVKLYLPTAEGDEAAEPSAHSVETVLPARSEEVVLLVEDDPGVSQMTVESLRQLGYTVVIAADASAALGQVRGEGRIDLLLSDIVMPGGMTGVELAREARSVRPDLSILLTSGYAADTLAGADTLPEGVEIMAKPYRRDQLARQLRRAMDRKEPAV